MSWRTLSRSFGWAATGLITYGVSQAAILVFLARFGGPADVGDFSYCLAVTAPIVLFFGFQLRSLQATDALGRFSFAEYQAIRRILGISALLVISALSISLFSSRACLMISLGAAKCMEAQCEVIYGLHQKHNNLRLVSRSLVVRSVASTLFFCATFYALGNLILASLSLLVAWTLVYIWHDLPSVRRYGLDQRDSLHRKRLMAILLQGLPLGAAAGAKSLGVNIPRQVLDHVAGAEELGYFAVASYFAVIGGRVVLALNHSASGHFGRAALEGKRQLARCCFVFSVLGLAVGVFGALASLLAGEQALKLLFGDDFGDASRPLTYIFLSTGLDAACGFLMLGLTAARVLKIQPALQFCGYAAIAYLSFLWVGEGAVGVSQAFAMGNGVRLALTSLVLVWSLRTSAPETHDYGCAS